MRRLLGLVARPGRRRAEATEWTAINACLMPAAALDGQEVVTAEGLGTPDALHPVQHEMAVRGGSQCGYCTPGFVCSMAAEYYRAGRRATNGSRLSRTTTSTAPNGFDLHALSGNLCRCTGYRPIRTPPTRSAHPAADDPLAARAPARAGRRADPARRRRAAFVRPADLAEALALLAEQPDAIVVAGCTDWGVEVNLRGAGARLVVAVDRLARAARAQVGADEIRIGAALTLTEIERRLTGRCRCSTRCSRSSPPG